MSTFYDLTFAELSQHLKDWGWPAYRAQQVWQAVYRDLAAAPAHITTLPQAARAQLAEHWSFEPLTPVTEIKSNDRQTRKMLFALPDKRAIETVLMEYSTRRTTCISTQAGCAMGCVFCATGQMGFKRHLSAGEIVAQVLFFARELKARNDRLTNIVVMGMGEPFHNYEATLRAMDILNDEAGFNFGARRITMSTVGLVPMIERFAAEKRQINLAVSLHAATDDLRSELLPINKKYPLAVLLRAVRHYVETTQRRVTFEWALIQGKNDTPEQARALGQLLKGLLCHVNVIPLNPTRDYAGAASTRERVTAFREVLANYGVECTVRVRRGIDVNAGCGQLAVQPNVSLS